jgi:glucokinase
MRGGIDLGGTKILAVIVDEEHRIVGQSRRPTPTEGGPARIAAEMAEALRNAAATGGVPLEVEGVGVGAPGSVDAAAGSVAHSPNIPGWDAPFPLAQVLRDELGTPVFLGNDVGVAVEGEARLGAGRPYGSFLGVWWGTGVGGGIVLDGRQWRGRGAAGELGHMVVNFGGRSEEARPLRGTVEAYAGRGAMELRARKLHEAGKKTTLFEIMREKGAERLTSGVWARALEQGDKLAHSLIDDAVEALAAGVASAVTLLDVEAIVIGGGLGSRLGRPYAERIGAAILPQLFSPERPPVVAVSELGDYAGAVGATLLVDTR